MTTLPPFHLSITAESATPATAAPATCQVLDLGLAGPPRGSFPFDQESSDYDLSWESLAQFNAWRQEQERADTVELRSANTKTGVYFTWRRIYRCACQGTGGLKGYNKIYPDKIRKIGTKRTSCSCVLVIKSYPKTAVILGHYSNQHDHPIHMDNLKYVQISDNAKTTIRDLLEMGVERSEIVRNFKLI